jgi:hypothetical protein
MGGVAEYGCVPPPPLIFNHLRCREVAQGIRGLQSLADLIFEISDLIED